MPEGRPVVDPDIRDREVGSSNLPAPTHKGLSYRGRPEAEMPHLL
jgi:hypothetical protein